MAAGRRSVAPNQGGFAGLPLPRCGIMSQRSVKWLIHLFQFAPLKSGMTTSIWRQEGTPWHQNQKQLRSHMSSG